MADNVAQRDHSALLHIASGLQSDADHLDQLVAQIVTHGDELANSTMRGAAGVAAMNKLQEAQAQVQRHTAEAREKAQAIAHFAIAGLDSTNHGSARIMAVASL